MKTETQTVIGTKVEYTEGYTVEYTLVIFNKITVFNFWLVEVKPHTVGKVHSIIHYLNELLLANGCFSSQFFSVRFLRLLCNI